MSREGLPRGIEFLLAKSAGSEAWYWTVYLPTQINKEKTREIAEQNLAKTIANIKKGKFLINERDFNTGKNIDYVGGVGHLLEKYELDEAAVVPERRRVAKAAKRVSKKPKRKAKVKPARIAKRVPRKKLRGVRKRIVPRVQRQSKRSKLRPKGRRLRVLPKRKKNNNR
jgi:hypothetical protein